MNDIISALCAKPIAELEAMSDEQLLEYFKPVLSLTRPENVIVNTQSVAVKIAAAKPKKPVKNSIEESLAKLPPEIRAKLEELNKQRLL